MRLEARDRSVVLRAPRESDSHLLYEMMDDPMIEKFVIGWSLPTSFEAHQDWFNQVLHANGNDRKEFRCIIDAVGHGPVGMGGISNIDWKNRSCIVHIKIHHTDHRGKGIGSKAMEILLDYVFIELGMNISYSEILQYNRASLALFRKMGYTIEGKMRQRIFKGGKFHDVFSVSILAHEWQERREKQIMELKKLKQTETDADAQNNDE